MYQDLAGGICVPLFSLRCDRLSENMEGCGSCMKECVLLRCCWKTVVQQEASVTLVLLMETLKLLAELLSGLSSDKSARSLQRKYRKEVKHVHMDIQQEHPLHIRNPAP